MNSIPNTDSIPTSVIQPSLTGKQSKNSVQAPSIARPSKGSKSLSKGLKLELQQSIHFHQHSVPLLVSSQILRSRQLGQIDLARMVKLRGEWLIEVAEVKSSQTGLMAMRGQKGRLMQASNLLGKLFGLKVKLSRLVK